MIKKLAIYFAVASTCLGLFSCNEKAEEVEQTSTSAAVRTFSLAKNDSVLAHLDSVFFSIDLVKGLIFNADSMPLGTDITAMVPVITTLNGCSVAELTVKRQGKPDTVYNYLSDSDAAIDFTNPVNLRVVSPDGLVERNYTINVNVHRVDADSLQWSRVDRRTIPSTFKYPERQHTVRKSDRLVCLTYYLGSYCLATMRNSLNSLVGSSSDFGDWEYKTVTFPAEIDLDSFTGGPDALYILDKDGNLYKSSDGTAWQQAGRNWHAIYGCYGNNVYGSTKLSDGSWIIEAYPDNRTFSLPKGMAVSGTSAPVDYSFSMSDNKQMMLVGGRKADGKLSADTWGFDGNSWARISSVSLPFGIEHAAVAPYLSIQTLPDWNTIEYPTMVLIGGRKADNTINSKVYISNDFGFTWAEAGSKLQLPPYMPAMYLSQAFVISSKLSGTVIRPKISSPIENWDCPYIYLFGGVNATGATSNNVWRGVINRLSFKPVE